MLNIKTLSISMFIFSFIAIYIMYLKGENEALKINLDRQKEIYINSIEAYEKRLKFLNSKSTFEKENLNNIQTNIKAKSITEKANLDRVRQQENSKRGLLDNEKSTNDNFTIVSF